MGRQGAAGAADGCGGQDPKKFPILTEQGFHYDLVGFGSTGPAPVGGSGDDAQQWVDRHPTGSRELNCRARGYGQVDHETVEASTKMAVVVRLVDEAFLGGGDKQREGSARADAVRTR